ncbi:helix-turn-helix domain-containing protein [Desulfurococcaceae archaeon MEX13E-LK6-19]|nr:helix-turn-helix domain-containing protein [Desulfurococcaceae archaeon MEX13E-LK6-19]
MYITLDKERSVDKNFVRAFCSLVCGDRSDLSFKVYTLLVDEGTPLTLSEIKEKLGLPRTTLWRILRDLEIVGMVKRVKLENKDYWVPSGLYYGLLKVNPYLSKGVSEEELINMLAKLLADYAGRPWLSSLRTYWTINADGFLDYYEERVILRLTSDPVSITYTTFFYAEDDYKIDLQVNGQKLDPEISVLEISKNPPLNMAVVKIPIDIELSLSAKTPVPGIIRVSVRDRKRAIATRISERLVLCFNYTPLVMGAFYISAEYTAKGRIKFISAKRMESNINILRNEKYVADSIEISKERFHKITHVIEAYVPKYLQANWLILKTKTICPEMPRDLLQY